MTYHLNQEFTVVQQWTGDSKSPKTLGLPTIHIILKGVLDRKEYRTYIVEGFRNVKLWQEILKTPTKQLVLRFPNGRLYKNIIDADSTPEVVTTRDEMLDRVKDLFE